MKMTSYIVVWITVVCLCTTSAGVQTTVKSLNYEEVAGTAIATSAPTTKGTTLGAKSGSSTTVNRDPKEAARQATLELSKEIFRNISKQLRESIANKDFSIFTTIPTNQDEKDELHPFRHQIKHHHEHHWGPYFDEPSGLVQVSAHLGSETILNCRVGMLRDKTVMWLKRGVDKAQLLTVGSTTYSGDTRVSVKFQYPNNWRLSIAPVNKDDKGLYLCQVSTHPPRVLLTNLTVIAPVLRIVDEQGQEVGDRYYKAGSALELTCRVSRSYAGTLTTTTTQKPDILKLFKTTPQAMPTSSPILGNTTTTMTAPRVTTPIGNSTMKVPPKNNFFGLTWYKNGKLLTSKITWKNTSSTFRVPHSSQSDSGQYTCSISNTTSITVQVHVLAGETHAAVQHETLNCGIRYFCEKYLVVILIYVAYKLVKFEIANTMNDRRTS